jgi:hypothetical protein
MQHQVLPSSVIQHPQDSSSMQSSCLATAVTAHLPQHNQLPTGIPHQLQQQQQQQQHLDGGLPLMPRPAEDLFFSAAEQERLLLVHICEDMADMAAQHHLVLPPGAGRA